MTEDPGFTINWIWLVAQGLSFVLFIAVIVAIGLVLRKFVKRGRKLVEMDARLTRIEKSLERGHQPDEPER